MRINKKSQYGLLFVLYIERAGRANVSTASQNLKLSKTFLYSIAQKLTKAGVIKSFRGAHGGYQVVGNPTVSQVIKVLNDAWVLTRAEMQRYELGDADSRAFAGLVKNIHQSMIPVMQTKVAQFGYDLAQQEAKIMDSPLVMNSVN